VVSTVEWVLGLGTLFLSPNRFGPDEFKNAVATSSLNLVKLYHDVIWLRSGARKDKDVVDTISDGSQPPRTISTFPVTNIPVANCLSVLENTSLLLELWAEFSPILAEQIRQKVKFRIICLVELIKAILRLRLLYLNNGSMLVHRQIPARTSSLLTDNSLHDTNDEKAKKRPNLLSFLRNPSPILQDTNNRSIPISTTVAEIIWITRPFVYLYAYASHGDKSWWPIVLSISMDLLSWRLHKPSRQLSPEERDELARRFRYAIVFYLFRPPVGDLLFGKLETSGDSTFVQNIPGLKHILSFLNEILRFYRTRYFYTAATT